MSSIIGLDIGLARIGVARAGTFARLASPLTTLQNSDTVIAEIAALIKSESAELVVIGLPRNLSGDDTDQTRYCRDFGNKVAKYSKIEFQDEALTSRKAESELNARGKPFAQGDIDALAATYILEDYLIQHKD